MDHKFGILTRISGWSSQLIPKRAVVAYAAAPPSMNIDLSHEQASQILKTDSILACQKSAVGAANYKPGRRPVDANDTADCCEIDEFTTSRQGLASRAQYL